ncbi:TPA: hypothetical protein EYO57_25020 [Candidatus Poribacteria bacterium]|nr:hypothetical protein [Candidatus Poribacteria bacterium]
MIGKSPTNVLGQTTFSYDIRTDKTGTYRFSLNMGGWQHIVGPIAEIGKWTHVAGTYDGRKMVLYLKGIEVGQKPAKGKFGALTSIPGKGENQYY